MKKIVIFAGSNSSNSINLKLASYAGSLVVNANAVVMDMVAYPLPVFSEDLEKKEGFINPAIQILQILQTADAYIIGLNEHNSNVSAYFKNLTDWLSRLDRNFLGNKPTLLTATSPGGRGAISALEIMQKIAPRFGADLKGVFSLPKFHDNFKEGKIVDVDLDAQLKEITNQFSISIE